MNGRVDTGSRRLLYNLLVQHFCSDACLRLVELCIQRFGSDACLRHIRNISFFLDACLSLLHDPDSFVFLSDLGWMHVLDYHEYMWSESTTL